MGGLGAKGYGRIAALEARVPADDLRWAPQMTLGGGAHWIR